MHFSSPGILKDSKSTPPLPESALDSETVPRELSCECGTEGTGVMGHERDFLCESGSSATKGLIKGTSYGSTLHSAVFACDRYV